MRRSRSTSYRMALLLGVLFAIQGCSTFGGARPPGPAGKGCVDATLAPGTFAKRVRFEIGGTTRTYYVHVPEGLDPSRRSPLVLNFHGLNSGPLEQLTFSEFNVTADARKLIVAYPEALDASWNGGDCCPPASAENHDDVAFAKAVVQDISSQICVNPDRVYAVGFSNGGIMAHRLACEASDVFAATASVAGGLFLPGCAPERPVPMLSIHGTADELVAFSIAESSTRSWQQFNGCGPSSREDGRCRFHDDCRQASEVGLCTLPDVNHCWPGPGAMSEGSVDLSARLLLQRGDSTLL